jgi:hypothetical protein
MIITTLSSLAIGTTGIAALKMGSRRRRMQEKRRRGIPDDREGKGERCDCPSLNRLSGGLG